MDVNKHAVAGQPWKTLFLTKFARNGAGSNLGSITQFTFHRSKGICTTQKHCNSYRELNISMMIPTGCKMSLTQHRNPQAEYHFESDEIEYASRTYTYPQICCTKNTKTLRGMKLSNGREALVMRREDASRCALWTRLKRSEAGSGRREGRAARASEAS